MTAHDRMTSYLILTSFPLPRHAAKATETPIAIWKSHPTKLNLSVGSIDIFCQSGWLMLSTTVDLPRAFSLPTAVSSNTHPFALRVEDRYGRGVGDVLPSEIVGSHGRVCLRYVQKFSLNPSGSISSSIPIPGGLLTGSNNYRIFELLFN